MKFSLVLICSNTVALTNTKGIIRSDLIQQVNCCLQFVQLLDIHWFGIYRIFFLIKRPRRLLIIRVNLAVVV